VLCAALRRVGGHASADTEPVASVVARLGDIAALLDLRGATAAGTARVAALEVVRALAALGADAVDQALAASGVLQHAVAMFFALPWNNIVHAVVAGMVCDVLAARPDGGLAAALVAAPVALAAHLAAVFRDNEQAASRPRHLARLGLMGAAHTRAHHGAC
jgi:hypothetical protein